MPAALDAIVQELSEADRQERIDLLIDFAKNLPPLPPRLESHKDANHRVEECQSPVFIFVEVDDDSVVHTFVTAPREAPTTRGFASILAEGLKGLTVDEVLSVPADYPLTIGLTEAVSPLRIRGMMALLGRIQRQVREKSAAA